MSVPDRNRVFWRDFKSSTGLTLVQTVPGLSPGALALLESLLEALTPCKAVTFRREVLLDGPNPGNGATGPYATNRDCVTLYMSAMTGAAETPIPVVGVKPGILLADGVTVNPTQTDVAALITWLIANGTDQDGNPFTSYVRGFRGFIPGGP